jgi:hypothetical protein
MKKILLFSLLLTFTFEFSQAAIPLDDGCDFTNALKVYRNPENNFTRIEFCQTDDNPVKIDVISATGRVMESIPKFYETTGLKMVDLDTSQYKSGVYFVRVGNKIMKFLIG